MWKLGKGYNTTRPRKPILEPGGSDKDRSKFVGTTSGLDRTRVGHKCRVPARKNPEKVRMCLSPPPALVKRNIVSGSVLWKLKRALYGLRRSPKLYLIRHPCRPRLSSSVPTPSMSHFSNSASDMTFPVRMLCDTVSPTSMLFELALPGSAHAHSSPPQDGMPR